MRFVHSLIPSHAVPSWLLLIVTGVSAALLWPIARHVPASAEPYVQMALWPSHAIAIAALVGLAIEWLRLRRWRGQLTSDADAAWLKPALKTCELRTIEARAFVHPQELCDTAQRLTDEAAAELVRRWTLYAVLAFMISGTGFVLYSWHLSQQPADAFASVPTLFGRMAPVLLLPLLEMVVVVALLVSLSVYAKRGLAIQSARLQEHIVREHRQGRPMVAPQQPLDPSGRELPIPVAPSPRPSTRSGPFATPDAGTTRGTPVGIAGQGNASSSPATPFGSSQSSPFTTRSSSPFPASSSPAGSAGPFASSGNADAVDKGAHPHGEVSKSDEPAGDNDAPPRPSRRRRP